MKGEEIGWEEIQKNNPQFKFGLEGEAFQFFIDLTSKEGVYRQIKILLPENDLTWQGTFAGIGKNEFNFFDLKPKDGDNIIDMGCNYGLISMACAVLYPKCKIHAFDPCKQAISFLQLNCFINGIRNLVLYNTAVTDSEEPTLDFYSNLGDGPSCFVPPQSKEEDHTPVGKHKNTHIKNVLGEIKNICFLKMDIEGSEYGIFDYLFENIEEFQDNLPSRVHIEVHGGEDKKDCLIKKLKKLFSSDENIIKK